MAESVEKGYDHQFVDSTPDELQCLICVLIARDPQQSTCCGKVYCKTCVEELRKHSNTCPQCRNDMICFPDKRSERNIKSLKTKCDNSTNGCEWIGELGDLEKHSTACDYVLLPCPNECSDSNTPSVGDNILCVLRKDMDKHVNEECPKREYICSYCSEYGEYKEMTTTHLEECDYIQVPCPNEGCNEHIERVHIEPHLRNSCEFEIVPCQYKNIGCKEKKLRKDLEKHENDTQHHLQFAINKVSDHESKISYIDDSVEELHQLVSGKVSSCMHYQEMSEIKDTTQMQQNMLMQQENVIAHLQSVILFQSKEISELRSKLEEELPDVHYPWSQASVQTADASPSQKLVYIQIY